MFGIFKTAYEPYGENTLFTPSGTKIITEHREEMDSKGKRKLVKDRVINAYEKIQSSKESCDINIILRRAAEGDPSVLNMVSGSYMDIVDAPASLAEAQQFVIRAKNEFDQLPKEVRAKFENNAEMYVAAYGTQLWQDAVGITEARALEKQRKENEKKFKEMQIKATEKILEGGSITNE